jgi:hypothetical protein
MPEQPLAPRLFSKIVSNVHAPALAFIIFHQPILRGKVEATILKMHTIDNTTTPDSDTILHVFIITRPTPRPCCHRIQGTCVGNL